MNGPLLIIDAATYRGTVAVADNGALLAERDVAMRGADAERLMPAVADTLAAAGVALPGLRAIACGSGPGSFTSLRIAASIAKGLATPHALPLYAISSMLLIVAGARPAAAAGHYLATLDAMRGDVFAARIAVGTDGRVEEEGDVELVTAAEAARIASAEGRQVAGPQCAEGWAPHARGAANTGIAPSAFIRVDLATWEPSYGRLAQAQVQWEHVHGRSLHA